MGKRSLSLWRQGRRDGYEMGRQCGYHFGVCDALRNRHVPEASSVREARVMFVPARGAPYVSLDQGIAAELKQLVRELIVVEAGQDAVTLAAGFRPDFVLVLDALGSSFSPQQAEQIRRLGIKTGVWLPDDPYHSDSSAQIAPHYDYVFTLEQSCVPFYRQLGCQHVHYLPFAVHPEFVRPMYADSSYESDICLIGSAFWNRVAVIDEIAPYLATKKVKIIGYWWERLKHYPLLKPHIQDVWLPPSELFKFYSRSKIVLNIHRSAQDPSHNSNRRMLPAISCNPRLFEVAACGVMQIADFRPAIPELYIPGEEIRLFHSARELPALLDHYLRHDEERRVMAWKALRRTLRDHTFRQRLNVLLDAVFPQKKQARR